MEKVARTRSDAQNKSNELNETVCYTGESGEICFAFPCIKEEERFEEWLDMMWDSEEEKDS